MPARSLYVATRIFGLALLVPGSGALIGLRYFHMSLAQLGPLQGLWEYPWPMAALLELPLRAGITSQGGYILVGLCAALLLDAAFAWLLWRAGGRRMTRGLLLWLLVLPALGPILLSTFDVLPAAAAGAALLALAGGRAAPAGALLSLAGALKLWPLVGLPALAMPGAARQRARLLAAFLLAGGALLLATLGAGGVQRAVSPLTWQSERGLHVESIAALPLLWARQAEGGTRWTTPGTRFNAYEVQGPGTGAALQAARIGMLVALAGVALLHLRAFRAPASARSPALAALLFLVAVAAFLVTNKVFSPQYLAWLAAPMAALGALPGRGLPRADAAMFLCACVLTQLVFPFNYDGLVGAEPRASVIAALTLRDLLVVVLAARFAARAWRATAADGEPL